LLGCAFYGVLNFLGILQFGGYEKEAYFYFYIACWILCPIIFIYPTFKKEETLTFILYYFHSLYDIFITIIAAVGSIVFLIKE